MTFTELHEHIWDASDEERASRLDALDPITRKAWDIIRMFEKRKGFEYWWCPEAHGGMSSECNDEIFEELKKILAT